MQPWEQFLPSARATMTRGRPDVERLERVMSSAGELLRLLDEQGIDRAALVNYVAPDVIGFDTSVNEWVSRYVSGHEDRLVAIGSLHPRHTRDARAECVRLFDDLGIRMLKVHPPHQLFAANAYVAGDETLGEIYRAAEEHGRPVMIHTGTSVFPAARNRFADPMAVDDVAVDFPRLTIVLAHAGRPLYMDTAVFLARRHPNVRLDLSGIPPRKLLEYLPRLEEISDRCLWGTDFPSPGIRSMRENVDQFLAVPLTESAKRRILFDNAQALFGD